ncbi:MAG TPA: hypothetical protein VFC29_21605, partial [Candidatus Limnocylindrales bacterium]|nr:hypothetical protein [Candidatus Limnocylindrales bacterium]
DVRNFGSAGRPLNSGFKSSPYRTGDVPWESASIYERVRFTWTMNAQPCLVTYGVSSALSRRFGDYTLKWVSAAK